MTDRHELIPLGMDVPHVAQAFAASGMFSDARSEAQAVTKIIAGRELGLGPFAAMSGLHVMQGKVEVGAHVLAAAIKASPKYDYRVEAKTDEVCRIVFRERGGEGWEVIGVEEYTLADADRAGLLRNPTWRKFPKAMLFARAISRGYRTHCPDAVGAAPVYVEGELGGPTTVDAEVVSQSPDPVYEATARERAQADAEQAAEPQPNGEVLKARQRAVAAAEQLPEELKARWRTKFARCRGLHDFLAFATDVERLLSELSGPGEAQEPAPAGQGRYDLPEGM